MHMATIFDATWLAAGGSIQWSEYLAKEVEVWQTFTSQKLKAILI
jgi:hypothetical protein